jgi:hypothetical protein
MGRRGWWYEVSRDEYEETNRYYGSDIYALDARLKGSTEEKQPPSSPTATSRNAQNQQAFAQSRVFFEPPANHQALFRSKRRNTVANKHKKKAIDKPNNRSPSVSGTNNMYQSEAKKSPQESISLAQRQFVLEKIIALGSVVAVKEFYSSDDAVSKYAKSIAHNVLSDERVKRKSEDMKSAMTNLGAAEVTHAIKQKISKLKEIVKSSEDLTIRRIYFYETLEELRIIFRNSKDSFSSSDIENIQGLKEQFEKS